MSPDPGVGGASFLVQSLADPAVWGTSESAQQLPAWHRTMRVYDSKHLPDLETQLLFCTA
jgi:hypothetical protein